MAESGPNVRVVGMDEVMAKIQALGHAKAYYKEWLNEAVAPILQDPASYQRPDRFRGEWATERNGRRINWRPGYAKYVRVRIGPNGLEIRSRRPYLPALSAWTLVPMMRLVSAKILDLWRKEGRDSG